MATIDLVAVDRDAAHGGAVGVGAVAVFPDQIAGLAVERLDDVAGVVEEDDAVVDDAARAGCVPPSFIAQIHGQPQVLDVVAR